MIYAGLDEAIEDLNSGLGGLPRPAEAEDIWDDLWHQDAHHSTALEGNTPVCVRAGGSAEDWGGLKAKVAGNSQLRAYDVPPRK